MSIERKIMELKYKNMDSDIYKKKKQIRMQEIKKLRNKRNVKNANEYFAIVNRVSGEKRIKSRIRVLKKILEEKNDRKK